MNLTKFYGAPGTGKTYALIENVQKELENGLKIDEIGYLGFTRAAANEALERATRKFFGISVNKKLWFRTIHSACLYLLRQRGVTEKVVNFTNRKNFCQEHDMRYTWEGEESILGDTTPDGNLFFSIYGYIENAMMNPDEWKETDFSEDFKEDFPFLYDKWVEYKTQHHLIDFSDMIYCALDKMAYIPTKVLFVDEFQDLSPLQYRVIQQFMMGKERVYGAGDDDQALYRFQAAVPEIFLNLKCDENHVLPKSYRLPSEIWEKSKALISKNVNRQEKDIEPKGEGGIVKVITYPYPEMIIREIEGLTYILFRTNYLMNKFGWELASEGILYKFLDSKKEEKLGWTSEKKRKIYHSLCRNPDYRRQLDNLRMMGEISKGYANFIGYYIQNYGGRIEPRNITTYIGTIHSAKGREADTVILFDDITKRVDNGMRRSLQGLEDERRVFYVGMTRSRSKLVIVNRGFGTKSLSFDLPSRISNGFNYGSL